MTREEAINIVRNIYQTDKEKEALAALIPELAESEDERIRKVLLNLVSNDKVAGYTNFYEERGITCDDALAYLEKQKDILGERAQNITANMLEDGIEGIQRELIEFLSNTINASWVDIIRSADSYAERIRNITGKQKEQKCAPQVLPCSAAWFENGKEKQKEQKPAECNDSVAKEMFIKALERAVEQTKSGYELTDRDKHSWWEDFKAYSEIKPAEWSDDYREEDIQTRFAFYTYKDDPSVLYLSNVFVEKTSRNHGFGTRILKAAEKVAEAIGAITICLKVKQDSPANAWYRKRGYGYVTFEDGYDWLEKNLEYLKPAKSAEWSEEDSRVIETIIGHLERHKHYLMNTSNIEYCQDWLKSLRPQPHWKPSEEQIRPLEYAIEYFKKKKNDTTYLESLLNDLNKL